MRRSNPSSVLMRIDRSVLAGGLSAAALVVTPVHTDAAADSPATIAIRHANSGSAPSSLVSRTEIQSTTIGAVLRIRSDEEQWGETEQKRFEELAIAEAVGELTDDEAFELENLTVARRSRLNPRSGDEMLWEFKQRRLTADLLNTLSRYVEFYEGANSTWFATAQSSD